MNLVPPCPVIGLLQLVHLSFHFQQGHQNLQILVMEMILKGTEGGTFLNDYSYLKFNC